MPALMVTEEKIKRVLGEAYRKKYRKTQIQYRIRKWNRDNPGKVLDKIMGEE